ncbi:cytosolic carboxypeptidase 2-like isoform X6 [Mytilus edulis]|uniref:cytosolic carboxypeptidase 2-like isoform X6 n=1 Tax=Mytilus edulis TaxID=6550 RepID=UPI0039EDF8CA
MEKTVKIWDEGPSADYQMELNPYDSFMRKHLEHYGYYTGRNQRLAPLIDPPTVQQDDEAELDSGRNQGFRHNFSSYAEWEKTYGYNISSDSGSESDNDDSDSEGKKNGDNKLQEELLRTTQLVYSYQDGKGMVPKLREPRSLFALSKELGPQQAARWPSEIQVLNEKIKHMYYIPPEPEPFYKPTGAEKMPMVRGEENGGRLVFMYEPKACFFMRSRVNGCRTGPEKVTCNLKSPEDKTLLFDSRFESGNLARAVQTSETDYECWLRYDLYTTKNTQWFYFRVANTRPNVTYRFTIVNFMKPDSLYNYGMRPLMYSEKNAQGKKIGWIRCGAEIKYYKNNLKYQSGRGEKPFYSLTWTVQFPNSHDTVYFAHCFPYTYTDLQDYLLDCSNDPIKSKICKQRVLCRTLAGNLVYVLTITSPSQAPEDIKHKKAVVITSRVHPGECNASWMMKGFLDYLTGNSADAKLLRDTFIFKIVPMLNPDGVIVGNYRCSLAGRDLNRNYKTVLKDAYPSVWHTKNMIRRLLQEREIIVYCDLHGHSRKQNVFIYGCENRYSPDKRLKERVFPSMLNKNAPDKFHFESCKFKVQKSKDGTGRIVMWNMGILNSYTMEATFCGSTMGKMKGYHFSMSDYESLGFHFCDTLLDYCDPDKTKVGNVMLELEERMKRDIMTRLQRHGITDINSADIDLSDEYDSSLESSDGGSDSSVSDGPPVHLQFQRNYRGHRPYSQLSLYQGFPGHRPYTRLSMFEPFNKKKKKLKSKKERDRVRSSKDDTKTKERPASFKSNIEDKTENEDQCEKKNLSGHQSSHAKQDKVPMQVPPDAKNETSAATSGNTTNSQSLYHFYKQKVKTQSMRYMSNSANKRPKSYEVNGEKTEDQKGKRVLRSHATLSYTALHMGPRSDNPKGPPFTLKCEKSLVAPQFSNEYLEALTNAYLRNGFMNQGETPTQPHFRYSGSGKLSNAMPFQWEGLCPHHEQKVAASMMAAQISDSVQNGDGNVEEYVRSQINPQASISPISRTPTQRHILEVSASQQRQQELLQHRHCENKSGNAIRQHPCPFDECTNRLTPDDAKTGRHRTSVPSATFVNYDTPPSNTNMIEKARTDSKIELLSHCENTEPQTNDIQPEENGVNGMREREETHPLSVSHPDYLINPHNRAGKTRVQSAKGEKDVDNAVESIRELRQSLVSNATQQNLSPTTGGYIKRLMQETDRDIRELTDEIKHDIEVKKKMAEDQDDEDGEIEIPVEQQYVTDNSVPDQFNPNQNAQPNSVFDRNNYVQIDELPLTETLMGRGYPEQWKNFATQDSSTMTDFKKPHGRKKGIVSNYPMSDRTYERGPKVSGDTTPGNVNNNNFNRRIPDGTIVESYQISALDRTNTYKDIHNSNNSASSRHSKSGANYDLRPISDRNFQEQFHRKLKKGELRETNTIPPSPKDSNRSSCSQSVPPTVSDKYFEPSNRVRSAKGPQSKQLATVSAAEALPTKIQLMISQDHQEEKCFGGQFLPLSRTIRGPFYRGGTKKK